MLIFMASTSYLWYSKTSQEAFSSARLYLNEMLRVSNENLNIALKDVNYLVSSAARNDVAIKSVLEKKTQDYTSSYERLLDDRKIQDYLSTVFVYRSSLKGIMISDLENRSFAVGDMPSLKSVKDCGWYMELSSTPNESIFVPPHGYGSENEDDKVISIIRPIFSAGKVIGFVLADLKYSFLKQIYDINLRGEATILTLDNKSNQLIFNSPGKQKISISDSELSSLVDNFQYNNGDFITQINGSPSLITYHYYPLTKWTSIGIITNKQLLSKYNKISYSIIVRQLFFLAAGIIIIYIISLILTKNILKLRTAIKKFDKGSMDISVSITSNDEIEELSLQFNAMVVRIHNLVEDIKKSERAKRKSDMRVLEAQINPHFLYNTLNTISYLATLNGIESIKDVSNSLSCLMNINMSNRQFITLYEETEYIKSYLYIQNYKYSHKFEYNIIAEENLDKYMVPKLLIQPLIENALIHGISPMKGFGLLLIRFYRDGNKFIIRVQDNGVGIIPSRLDKILDPLYSNKGIGLDNVQNRIKLYFGDSYGLSVISEPNIYTTVELTIPLLLENEI